MRKALVLLAALLPACAMIGHEPVQGWPKLEVVEHFVPEREMQERCQRYVGFGMVPLACAEFNLATRTCHIWYSAESPTPGFIRKHERLHCAGYDHIGSTSMQRFLDQYTARQAASAAAGSSN
jgi:hypothetical protein